MLGETLWVFKSLLYVCMFVSSYQTSILFGNKSYEYCKARTEIEGFAFFEGFSGEKEQSVCSVTWLKQLFSLKRNFVEKTERPQKSLL
ncbi:hypothetical protein M5K25_010504 [Dendrobium thyrsiflorum]|uniref:Secreted protein n=1 Tax=Dendrobium thyrsiflorum TaxID=117978 RepID=A0ABD0V0J7_DENTH